MGVVSTVRAEDAPATPDPVAYRRVFVPADNVPAWPRGGHKYLPVEARDFDAWIAAANRSATNQDIVRIVDAEYSARLEGNRLVDGKATWKLEFRGDVPALLPLKQLALVVREPAWSHDPSLPVRMGWWSGRGNYGLQVPRSGTLIFAWHANATKQAGGSLVFPLHLPPATRQRLTLELPAEVRPELEDSVVVDSTLLAADKPNATPARRRWILAIGESSNSRLRIEDLQSEPALAEPTTTLNEDLTYRIDSRGLEVVTIIHLGPDERDLGRLSIKLPPDLHLLSAESGGSELTWRLVADPLTDGVRAIVRLPSMSSDGPLSVTLRAWAPLVTDQRWTLPTLRPEGTFWSFGTMKIEADPLIELRDLALADCVQTGVSLAEPSGSAPETLRFEAYSPAAGLAVVVGHRRPNASACQGTTLEIGDADITGRLVARLTVDRGSSPAVDAELQPGWSIDAVAANPTSALADWYVERIDNRTMLRLQFADGPTPGRPATVVVSGHLERSIASKPIAAGTLSMLEWQDVRIDRHLLLLRTGESYELDSPGQLPPSAEEELSDSDRSLLDAPTTGRLVNLLAAGADASVQLVASRGAYDAAIQIDAALDDRQLQQTWHIVCQPRGAGVERLLVYLSQPLGEQLDGKVTWQEAGSREPLVAERIAENDPRWNESLKGGELWEIRLRRLSQRTATIEATLTSNWPEPRAVPLLSLPDAANQQALVLVRTIGPGGVTLDTRGLTAVPLPEEPAVESTKVATEPIRAAFRYDTSQVIRGDAQPELRLGPDPGGNSGAALFAEQVQIESIYAINGQASHRVTYELQNRGAATVELQLPPGAQLESAHLDDHPIRWQTVDGDPARYVFPLPVDTERRELRLAFRTQGAPLASGRMLSPPLPQGGPPVLAGNWTIWLPEEYFADGISTGRPTRAPDPGTDVPLVGWQAYETTFVAGPPQPIRVTLPPTATAWAMAVFLVAAIGGAWLARSRAKYFIVLVAAAASLRLLLPATLSPLATGALLGLLFSLVLRGTGRGHTRPRTGASWSQSHTVPAMATTTVVLLLLLVHWAHGESPAEVDAAEPNALPTIQTVLEPVDTDGRPAGTKYFVSEEFLRTLLARGTVEARADDWLLREASYSGELKQPADQGAVVPGNWSMTLDVEVLARDTSIELPLVRDEATWSPTASLDGIPVPLTWNNDGRGCAIAVAEPGHYQLSILFEPRVTADADHSQVQLTIMPLVGARFQLACPGQLSDCQVPGQNVARTSGPAADLLTSELAAQDRLLVRWPHQNAPTDAVVQSAVAELLWLQIARNTVTLDAKYLLGTGENPVATFTILANERWELLTNAAGAGVRSIDVEPGPVQTIRVRRSDEDAGGREVLLRFRLRDGHALGRHRVPEIGLASPTAASRWLAVASDPSLECEAACDQSVPTATAEEFLSAWGDAAEAPQIVFPNIRELGTWDVAVRPRAGAATLGETLHVAAGPRELQLQYEAQVQPADDRCYRYEMAVPQDLSVSTIAVHETEQDVPFRWSTVEADSTRYLNVFFARPITGPYRLVLTGKVPVAPSGRSVVPRVAAATAEQPSERLVLYRDARADVELHGILPSDLANEQPDEIPPVEWSAHQVGVYQLDKQSAETAQIVVAERPIASVATSDAKIPEEHALHEPSSAVGNHVDSHTSANASPLEPPSVRLVDTSALADAAGGQVLVSRFILIPRGLARCDLRLPEGQQLICAELDGEPALLEPQEDREWRVQLGAPDLPQVLEVTTRPAVPSAADSSSIELQRPVLFAHGRPIPVELNLWSLGYPQADGEPQVVDAAQVTANEANAVRLDRLVGVAEGATESVRRRPEPDGRNWLVRWTRRLAAARLEAYPGSTPSAESKPSSQVSQSAEQQFTDAASRMDVWLEQVQDLFADREFEGALDRSANSHSLDRWPSAAENRWVYCLAAGGSGHLRVEMASVGPTSGPTRVGRLLAIFCAAGAAVWLAGRPAACDLLWRWPHAVGVLVGLACWAWLSPAWIGLLIAGGSLILLVWRGWPARSVYAEGSTVLRSYRRP